MAETAELQSSLNFDGPTFVAAFDAERLGKQLRRVYECMKDGKWRTLEEIQWWSGQGTEGRCLVHDSQAAISARLRDLRKIRNGRFAVDRRRRGEAVKGLFEYRVTKGVSA